MAELLKESEGYRKGGILVLAKSNSVVNDLVRKINKHIEEENSIIFC
jgi:senataxin